MNKQAILLAKKHALVLLNKEISMLKEKLKEPIYRNEKDLTERSINEEIEFYQMILNQLKINLKDIFNENFIKQRIVESLERRYDKKNNEIKKIEEQIREYEQQIKLISEI